MKVLSVQNPYSYLICYGIKDVENRSAIDPVKDDYTLTFVFQNNKDKRDFMAKIKLHINTQSNDYLPAEYLANMLNGQYALK